jgi:hypothetical protein
MSNSKSKVGEIASESAYVVHDKTGRIIHAHTVTHYKGAQAMTPKEEKAIVLAAAKQFGHKTEGVTVAAVALKDLDFSAPLRMDLKTSKLMRVGPKAKSAPSKSALRKTTKPKPKGKAKR